MLDAYLSQELSAGTNEALLRGAKVALTIPEDDMFSNF